MEGGGGLKHVSGNCGSSGEKKYLSQRGIAFNLLVVQPELFGIFIIFYSHNYLSYFS